MDEGDSAREARTVAGHYLALNLCCSSPVLTASWLSCVQTIRCKHKVRALAIAPAQSAKAGLALTIALVNNSLEVSHSMSKRVCLPTACVVDQALYAHHLHAVPLLVWMMLFPGMF